MSLELLLHYVNMDPIGSTWNNLPPKTFLLARRDISETPDNRKSYCKYHDFLVSIYWVLKDSCVLMLQNFLSNPESWVKIQGGPKKNAPFCFSSQSCVLQIFWIFFKWCRQQAWEIRLTPIWIQLDNLLRSSW